MAANNRGGKSGGTRTRNARNNNPDGRNQYSGLKGKARQNPLAAAAAVGTAVAAGVFLWSRRSQLSDQIAGLSDQINEWRGASGYADEDGHNVAAGNSDGRTQAEIAEEALTLKETGRPA